MLAQQPCCSVVHRLTPYCVILVPSCSKRWQVPGKVARRARDTEDRAYNAPLHSCVYVVVCVTVHMCVCLLCVNVATNQPRKEQQQQSFVRRFSRSFVTVPSPTEPGFVSSLQVWYCVHSQRNCM